MIPFIAFSCLSLGVLGGFVLCALFSINGDDDNG
jgi:hypothetical protein